MRTNKTVIIIAVVCVVACACVLCLGGGGVYVASNPSLVVVDQLDNYQFTPTPYVVMELPANPPPGSVPTSTPIPTTAPVPVNTPPPTSTPIVFNLEQVQAMAEVGLEDFTPFFAEISRQTWDDEITDAQSDEKREKLRSIFDGKRLRDTRVTVTDASFYEYSKECRLRTKAEYIYSIGHTWVDMSYDEISVLVEIADATSDYCTAFTIGQELTVSGDLDFTYSTVTIVNAVVK